VFAAAGGHRGLRTYLVRTAGRRHGGDADFGEQMLPRALHPVRDRVLDRAELQPDDTLFDIGCGDGLIAFGALDRLGLGGNAQLRPLMEAGAGKDRLAVAYPKASGVAQHRH